MKRFKKKLKYISNICITILGLILVNSIIPTIFVILTPILLILGAIIISLMVLYTIVIDYKRSLIALLPLFILFTSCNIQKSKIVTQDGCKYVLYTNKGNICRYNIIIHKFRCPGNNHNKIDYAKQ